MRTFIFGIFLLSSILPVFSWDAKGDKIKTKWAEEVSPTNVWKNYPRPQLQRADWTNLNGLWQYKVTKIDDVKPTKYDGEILVPFCIESSLSGVAKRFTPTDKLWYKKVFTYDKSWKGKSLFLNFGAVDYESTVWVNKKMVGKHIGGFNPFSFDITKFLTGKGEQTIEVAVVDPTDKETINRGKQQLSPNGIWYTPVSGIWQTVWLEPVSKTAIENILPETNIDNGSVKINSTLLGENGDEQLTIRVLKGGQEILNQQFKYNKSIEFSLKNFDLWSPESPTLYKLELKLTRNEKVLDQVKSYFAMRKVAVETDEMGYKRIYLNNKQIFQMGTLDQGWWPDGLLTPPSANAMQWDIVQLKAMGFNTIRKHIKIEPALYYYYTDSIGMMVWQDMPSGFATERKKDEHISPSAKEDWKAPIAYREQWKTEYDNMVKELRFFPSITTWVVFNEGWGQFDTKNMVQRAMDLDKTRIINGVTGWTDREVGNMIDIHNYPSTSMDLPEYSNNRVSSIGEFGGLGLPTKDHIWNPEIRNWGYKNMDNTDFFAKEFKQLIGDLETLIPQGLSSAIYTQTTDVEGEVNGLITYDRKIIKIPITEIAAATKRLYSIRSVKPQILISDARRGKISKEIKLNENLFVVQEMPFGVKEKSKIVSKKSFFLSDIPQNLSLWLNVNGEATIKINGQNAAKVSSRDTRNYNQFNISNAAKLLHSGENIFEIEIAMSKEKTDFDYGLTAY